MSRVFFRTRLPSLTDCWLTLFFFCVLQLPRSNKTCPSCKHEEAVFFQSQQRSAETGMVSHTDDRLNIRQLTLVEIVLCLLRVWSHLHIGMTCMNTPEELDLITVLKIWRKGSRIVSISKWRSRKGVAKMPLALDGFRRHGICILSISDRPVLVDAMEDNKDLLSCSLQS